MFIFFSEKCGGVFNATADDQMITTPGWPKGYPYNLGSALDCVWVINSNDLNIIKMKFTDFHIEYFSCYYDFVYVYEDGVQSAKICGSKNDPPFQIHANRTFFAKNQLRISFHTDAYDIFEGFRAVFSFGK